MKKLLIIILAIAMCFSLTACDIPEWAENILPDFIIDLINPEQPVEYNLSNAASYLKSMYINDPVITAGDYKVTNQLLIRGVKYSVVWTTNVDSVTCEPIEGSAEVLINVDEETLVDIPYILTATIHAGNGETTTVDFEHLVPGYKLNTWEEYRDAKNNEALTIQGVVTGILSKDAYGDTDNGLYLQDSVGGYYVYQLSDDPVAAGIKIGMTVEVKGVKDNYNGTLEIKNASVKIIDETIKEITPVDYTDIYQNAETLKDTALVDKQALLITIKGVELLAQTADDVSGNYYRFQLGELSSYVRISSSNCPLNKEDTEAFIKAFKDNVGKKADVTGLITIYNGALYLTPVSVDAYSNFAVIERTDAEKVQFEKDLLDIVTKVEQDTVITLPTAGTTYTDVTITWTAEGAEIVDGKVTLVLGEEAATVKLTATLASGEATDTKVFEIAVDAIVNKQYIPNFVTSAPAAGQYVFAMDQSAVEGYGILYATGEISSKGALLTTDKAHKAAIFDIAVVEGGYTIQLNGKYLEGYLNGTYKNLRLVDESTAVWTWNDEVKLFTCVVDGKDYYFGTYLQNNVPKYDYMSLSEVSYISGNNVSKIDVSQFVGHLTTLVEVADKAFPVETAPATGKYIFGMNQSAVEGYGWLYATGEISSKGALLTTKDINKAAYFDITAVEGGYTIQLNGKYLEGYLNGTYKNLRLVDESTAVWTWNTEVKLFTCVVDGKDYYFGTYLQNNVPKYDYMSLSEVSYIAGNNVSKIDVSQFVGHLCDVKLVPVNGCTGEHTWDEGTVTKAATCEAAGTKKFVCASCGMTKTEEIGALGHKAAADYSSNTSGHYHVCENDCKTNLDFAEHTYVEGVCSVCSFEEPSVVPGEVTATYDFVANFGTYSGSWANGYNTDIAIESSALGSNLPAATVTFSRVSKQSNTINDRPVIAANNATIYVTFALNEAGKSISEITFNLKQWSSSKKFSSVKLEYYDGANWVDCGVSLTLNDNGSLKNAEEVLTATITAANVTQVRLAVTTTQTSNQQIGFTSVVAKVK